MIIKFCRNWTERSGTVLTLALSGAVHGGRDMFLDGFILIASSGCQNRRRRYRPHHRT